MGWKQIRVYNKYITESMKIINWVSGLLVGGILLVSCVGIAFEVQCWNKVYPGIRMGGEELGGLNPNQVVNKIENKASQTEEILLRWGVNKWVITASNIGLVYEPEPSAMEALLIGRSGNWGSDLKVKWKALLRGVDIDPVWSWNNSGLDQAIASIAAQIDIPAMEPEIVREKDGKELIVSPGEDGRQVNITLLKVKLRSAIKTWGGKIIDIPVTDIRPKLTDEQVELVKTKAAAILGKNLIIDYQDEEQKWEVGEDQILTWLDLPSGGWKRNKIKEWVSELAQTVNRSPQNSTFKFLGEGKVEEFKPAKDGVTVLEENTTEGVVVILDRMIEKNESQTMELETRKTEPEIATGDANGLGIKELIGKGESWFTGSITNRIYNLKRASETISGILVAPGEVFSFNKAVGEVSANTGYKQAYIIKEGKTILGDGGGVCQVSTTLFRAILAAGLPIKERTAHAYRVSYYEVKYQPGFDATVFQPSPDFKFENDTGNYILIQVVYDEKSKYLSFEIYGTNDGRKVEMSKARIWEVTSPPPDLYQDDPTLPVGKVVQTEHAARGAKVAFDWKVTRGEEVLQQRTFYSNYRPWQAVYLRGTKVN